MEQARRARVRVPAEGWVAAAEAPLSGRSARAKARVRAVAKAVAKDSGAAGAGLTTISETNKINRR